jgi:hypothetical protein
MAPLPSSAQFDVNPTASIIHVSTSALCILNKAVVNSNGNKTTVNVMYGK